MDDDGVEAAVGGVGYHLLVARAFGVCPGTLVTVDFEVAEVRSEFSFGVLLGGGELSVKALVGR